MRLLLAAAVALGGCKKSGPAEPRGIHCADDCEKRCDGGDAAECAKAAEAYHYGRFGRPLDPKRAIKYARAACDGGVGHGCTLLGLHFQDGVGTAWDPAKALEIYEKGCAAGAGTSCYNLGSMYSGGHGVTADPGRAEALIAEAQKKWTAACEGSEPRWCTNAAFGLPAEAAAERQRLNKRACDHGVAVGCTGVVRGRRASGEIDAAIELAELEALCDKDEPSACAFVAAIRIAGPPELRDPVRGVAAANRGCDLGDTHACMVGAEHSAGKPAEVSFLERGCDRAFGAACSILGSVRGRSGDVAGARDAARRACQMGEARDCATVAGLALGSAGGEPDKAAGIRWATEACRMGHFPSCQLLIKLEAPELPVPPQMRRTLFERTCAGLAGNAACARLSSGTP